MTSRGVTSWAQGYGVISHSDLTLKRLNEMFPDEQPSTALPASEDLSMLFSAADKLANAAMWVVAHMTYASRVDFSGKDLPATAFKTNPEGHTGGSLNMAIAYVGYLTANILSGHTRAWALEQGHCVAAIEAVNALVADPSEHQKGRYDHSEIGLSRLVSDFYSYAITADGHPAVPLGSHVSPHTAGGLSEGGYLGFTSVQYVHMPMVGERLVAFLSDGAFEEQRGSDWSPRWWRAEDCGLSVPVMILNGRRIEQRTQIGQQGGAEWLESYLELNGFNPIIIDGHDPLAYAWAILEAEARLTAFSEGPRNYPARLPYIIAKCVKGFGFPGAGKNSSHNLPLEGNPRLDEKARNAFNKAARKLFVSQDELAEASGVYNMHDKQQRPKESQNSLVKRFVASLTLPEPEWRDEKLGQSISPMSAIDEYFVSIINANPNLRPRVGNPDELRSNKMAKTLELLCHRVNKPEAGTPEAIEGGVITALNEEAVIGAVLGNKGGINLAVSYEAFAMKMLGALRQEIIFTRNKKNIGQKAGWLSLPLILTSHTWENSKNEQSHQDPTLVEALLGEMSDTARVIFPIDANSAMAALRVIYNTRGEIGCCVISKRDVPNLLSGPMAEHGLANGAVNLQGTPETAAIQIIAIGAYQTQEALMAAQRLEARGYKSCVTVILEPGRFRMARDKIENNYTVSDPVLESLFPADLPRIILSHTRPEPMLGLLRRLDGGTDHTRCLGYISRGGTLDVFGMLFANRSTWAHAINEAAGLLKIDLHMLLSKEEMLAVDNLGNPQTLNRDS